MATLNATNPRLTLSLGGVEFSLIPADASAKVHYGQSDNQEIVLDLATFTGRLIVKPSAVMTADGDKEGNNSIKVTPKFANYSTNGQKKRHLESTSTSSNGRNSRPLLQQLLQEGEDADDDLNMRDDCFAHSESLTPTKKLKKAEEDRPTASLAVDEDDDDEDNPEKPSSQTQETILAQMELSQTQPSVMSQTQPSNDDVDRIMSDEPVMQVENKIDLASNMDSTSLSGSHQDDAEKSHEGKDALSGTTMKKTPQPTTSEKEIGAKERGVGEIKQNVPSEKANVAQVDLKKKKKDKPKKKVAKSTPIDTSDMSFSDGSVSSTSMKRKNQKEKKDPPRVSIGTPDRDIPKAVQPPPRARWGHTVTAINNGRFLVYGGQGFDPTTKLPRTFNDLFVYDMNKKTWFKPFSGEGAPLQWHSSTYLPDRQLLLAFGGESMNPKSGKVRTHSKVTVLDTELMVWYPPTVSGEVPSGRSGHAASMVDQDLVVFGGVKGSKWLNTVSVLNTQNWVWRQLKIQGSAPKPRSYPSATTVLGNKIVFFGGNDAEQSFVSVHVLEKVKNDGGEITWNWSHPMVTGYGPAARTGHSATLLSDGKTICIYGGWDPNDDDGKEDEALIFSDAFLLDTESWQWKKLSASLSKRVGHKAILWKQGNNDEADTVVAFGGRFPHDVFTNEIEFLTVPKE